MLVKTIPTWSMRSRGYVDAKADVEARDVLAMMYYRRSE
jgi:hypothetical protein